MQIIKRIAPADYLKGLAAILMIQVHLSKLLLNQDIFNSITGQVSRFMGGCPVTVSLMSIMGYFIAYTGKNASFLLKRSMQLIILGLFLNVAMNLNLLVHIYDGKIQLSPWEFLFGIDILFLAGASILLITLLKPIFKDSFIPYFVSAAMITLIAPHLPVYSGNNPFLVFTSALFSGKVWWAYFPFFPWAAYPLSGYGYFLFERRYLQEKNLRDWKILIFSIGTLCLVPTMKFGFTITIVPMNYYHHGFLFYIWSNVFLVCWVIAFSMIESIFSENRLSEYLRWIGRNITSFYCFQWILIGNLSTSWYKTQPLISFPFLFIAILSAASLGVFCWKKILP